MIKALVAILLAFALLAGVVLLNDSVNFAYETAGKYQQRVYLGDDENGNEVFIPLKDATK